MCHDASANDQEIPCDRGWPLPPNHEREDDAEGFTIAAKENDEIVIETAFPNESKSNCCKVEKCWRQGKQQSRSTYLTSGEWWVSASKHTDEALACKVTKSNCNLFVRHETRRLVSR